VPNGGTQPAVADAQLPAVAQSVAQPPSSGSTPLAADAPSVPAPQTSGAQPSTAHPAITKASGVAAAQTSGGRAMSEPEAWRDSDHLALPLPPAPPGERGYRPGDVERFMQLLTATLGNPDAPEPDELANLKLSRTFFIGQGYHAGAVDILRQAWLDELQRRAR
jgi:hypothetical protein